MMKQHPLRRRRPRSVNVSRMLLLLATVVLPTATLASTLERVFLRGRPRVHQLQRLVDTVIDNAHYAATWSERVDMVEAAARHLAGVFSLQDSQSVYWGGFSQQGADLGAASPGDGKLQFARLVYTWASAKEFLDTHADPAGARARWLEQLKLRPEELGDHNKLLSKLDEAIKARSTDVLSGDRATLITNPHPEQFVWTDALAIPTPHFAIAITVEQPLPQLALTEGLLMQAALGDLIEADATLGSTALRLGLDKLVQPIEAFIKGYKPEMKIWLTPSTLAADTDLFEPKGKGVTSTGARLHHLPTLARLTTLIHEVSRSNTWAGGSEALFSWIGAGTEAGGHVDEDVEE